ncbi:hypothetical protein PF003_g2340 [Phytophthora fragariae]|nr:hypothetical protein PF003_g2340 [Phytophthora fragariae]
MPSPACKCFVMNDHSTEAASTLSRSSSILNVALRWTDSDNARAENASPLRAVYHAVYFCLRRPFTMSYRLPP